MFFHRLSLRLSPLRHSMSLLRFIMKKDKAKARFFVKLRREFWRLLCRKSRFLLIAGKSGLSFQRAGRAELQSKTLRFAGNPGLEKAGYVRAAAAKIIRAAKPEKMSFKAQLMRIDCRNVVLIIEL